MSKIMGISRLRTGTDGKGITTLVTFYQCPLKCKYCINDKCHDDGDVLTDYTAEELLDLVMIDDLYFRMSDGGVTFGGGEPLMQTEFLTQFVAKAPQEWKIRIETSLNVHWTLVEPLVPYIDQWIIDIKDMNYDIYKAYTGISNANVKKNLSRLSQLVPMENLYIRVPKIPGYNKPENIEKSLRELSVIDCTKEVFEYLYIETAGGSVQ